jgi:hypothetical protein
MHTVHSDGEWTIADLIASAEKRGLDFISITDHNTSSHHHEINSARKSSRLLVLRGEEITTYGGHMNAWGLPSGTWIDFRIRPGDSDPVLRAAEQVHRVGALISANHPFGACGGCSWSYQQALTNFDAIEVWNGSWDLIDEQAVAMWDKLLQTGRQITAIGSSDSHRAANPIGTPTANVQAPTLKQIDLLAAIRRGRVYLTNEVGRPKISFEARTAKNPRLRWQVGDRVSLNAPQMISFQITAEGVAPDATISLISNGSVIRHFLAVATSPIEIECREDTYYRLEARDKTKSMLALTNPIYIKVGAKPASRMNR